MSKPELQKKKEELDAYRAEYESKRRELGERLQRREDRNVELLLQISKQLESIEQLVRERIGKFND